MPPVFAPVRVAAALLLLLAVAPVAHAECVGANTDDCDEDGFRISDGDCDDNNPDVRPGAVDACNDFDDDCDGLEDENCVDTALPGLDDATLAGGDSCSGGTAAWLLLLPLLGLRRRP